jgi:hypothetical protein
LFNPLPPAARALKEGVRPGFSGHRPGARLHLRKIKTREKAIGARERMERGARQLRP